MLPGEQAKEYAEFLIRSAANEQSIGWDRIAECWPNGELTEQEINQVYGLIFDAKISITWE